MWRRPVSKNRWIAPRKWEVRVVRQLSEKLSLSELRPGLELINMIGERMAVRELPAPWEANVTNASERNLKIWRSSRRNPKAWVGSVNFEVPSMRNFPKEVGVKNLKSTIKEIKWESRRRLFFVEDPGATRCYGWTIFKNSQHVYFQYLFSNKRWLPVF